jgi:hypothetical protein
VAALRAAESRLSAELASCQSSLAEARRGESEVKRALAEARDREAERLVLEVYPLMRAQYILAAAAALPGDAAGGFYGRRGLAPGRFDRACFATFCY